MLKEAIADVTQRRSLSRERMLTVFEEIFAGRGSPAQIGALLVALRMKGETSEEITGAALALRARALFVRAPEGRRVMDTCGTGGDGTGTFNISTAVAFVLAAAGVTVAKHGNTRVSSNCGSADVLAAAGVLTDAPLECLERCLDEVGVGFLFAPTHHPVMRHVSAVRRELGVRSIFNILGPLANPARASRQLVGVYDHAIVETVAAALVSLGTERSLVVHGEDGLDEVSPAGPTRAVLVDRGVLRSMILVPEDAGAARVGLADIQGASPEDNARTMRDVLAGARGPVREAVVLNAAAALWVADVAPDLRAGGDIARRLLDEGSPRQRLEDLVAMTAQYAGTASLRAAGCP